MKPVPTIHEVDDSLSLLVADLAERLRSLRMERGLTQTRLAELIDVSPRVYNRWETGSAVPRLDTLIKVADIFRVSLDELAGRTEPTSAVKVHNPKLSTLYERIDELPDEDQQAVMILLDSLVKRAEVDKVMAR